MLSNNKLVGKTEITLTREIIREHFQDTCDPVLHSEYAPGDVILRCKTCGSIIRKDVLSGSACPADVHHQFVRAPVFTETDLNLKLKSKRNTSTASSKRLEISSIILLLVSALSLFSLYQNGCSLLQLGQYVFFCAAGTTKYLFTIAASNLKIVQDEGGQVIPSIIIFNFSLFWDTVKKVLPHGFQALYYSVAVLFFRLLACISLFKFLIGKPVGVRRAALISTPLCLVFSILCFSVILCSQQCGSANYVLVSFGLSTGAIISVFRCLFIKRSQKRMLALLAACVSMFSAMVFWVASQLA